MRDIFVEENARFVAREAEAKTAGDTATTEREEKVALKDSADAEVKAQKAEVTTKQKDQKNAIEVIKECEEEMTLASGFVSESESKRSLLITEQEGVLKIQANMKSLKDEFCENPKELKKHLSDIAHFLRSIDTEDALIKTVPQIFGRKPEERGDLTRLLCRRLRRTRRTIWLRWQ